MKKKFITLGIAFLMLFSLAACNDFDLEGYKAEAKAEIASYATESNYCTDNWSIVCGIVDAGKASVDAAGSKAGVDTAVKDAKDAIDEVDKEELEGMFYSLDDAFDNGWLTTEQLQSIAYYYYEECIAHDHVECEPFVPMPKNPLTLDNRTQTAIKQEYLDGLTKLDYAQDATLNNITIRNYLGTYDECIIVGITDDCALYDYLFETEHFIGGVLFCSYCGNFARVWKVN